MKNVLIISSSPRKNGNSQMLCEKFSEGAKEKGHSVDMVRLTDLNIGFCRACDVCLKNGGNCILKDDMPNLIELYKKADVVVLATPVYFYGISAPMKTFIDRMYPIWTDLGSKDIYYIVSAGLGEEIINRSLGDLDGFVEHLTSYRIKGRIYATNVMEAGEITETPILDEAYQMGLSV